MSQHLIMKLSKPRSVFSIRWSRMTSLNKHEMAGTVHRIENDALFEFLSETVLERCGPVKWPIP